MAKSGSEIEQSDKVALPEGYSLGEELKSDVIPLQGRKMVCIRVNAPMEVKDTRDKFNGGRRKQAFLPATDLETGAVGVVFLDAALTSIFSRYGNDLQGQMFAIQQLGKSDTGANKHTVHKLQPK